MPDIREIEKFITDRDVAFISSVDKDGYPNTKAMLPPRKHEGLRVIYFTTNTSSLRTGQYKENPKACVYFYHKGITRYAGIMLKGTMEVLEDAESKEMIWRKGDTMYYPKGVTDPDYCVLKFTAFEGRYYGDLKTESFTVE